MTNPTLMLQKHQLIQHFQDYLTAGDIFQNITQARREAKAVLGQDISPGTPLAKLVDEAIESAAVRVGRTIVAATKNPTTTYQKLVGLQAQLPNMSVRTSSSIANQAYSTPLPIAYVAAQAAKIRPGLTVYEPTAGHGALLLTARPEDAIVNEIDPVRGAEMRSQGFAVHTEDAATFIPERKVDIVISNPPFGTTRTEPNKNKIFTAPLSFTSSPYKTSRQDEAFPFLTLQHLREGGRGVLILPGYEGSDDYRSGKYQSRQKFHACLQRQYAILDHITLSGNLYAKQGTKQTVDLLILQNSQGDGSSSYELPAPDLPPVINNYDELGEYLASTVLTEQYRCVETSTQSGIGQMSLFTARPDTGQDDSHPRSGDLSGFNVPTGHVSDLATRGERGRHSNGASSGTDSRTDTSDTEHTWQMASLGERSEDNLDTGMGRGTGAIHAGVPGGSDDAGRDVSLRRDARGERETGNVSNAGGHTAQSDESQRAGHNAQSGSVVQPADGTGSSDNDLEPEATQVPYIPISQGSPLDPSSAKMMPTNLATAMREAVQNLTEEVGDIDHYVATKLEYAGKQDLFQYFGAEQIDSLALAINNIDHGKALIIGHQTGVGKGRINAGIIRYATVTNRTPIFVTRKNDLYRDMMRDLSDIGMRDVNFYPTDSNYRETLQDGRKIAFTRALHEVEMADMMAEEALSPTYQAVFTTYSQLQTVKGGEEPPRRNFLRTLAPQSLLIMDESHEIGGETVKQWRKSLTPDCAEFVRELQGMCQGGLYSSATFAKKSASLANYRMTELSSAVHGGNPALQQVMVQGGIPLQQYSATLLAKAGQYVRLESSFAGKEFDQLIVPIDRELTDRIAEIMHKIVEFDVHKKDSIRKLDKDLKREAKNIVGDGATGGAGLTSTNFSSLMHNFISQMLLALKTEEVVKATTLQVKSGQKPVIALSNTMGSFIEQSANDLNITSGDALSLGFGDLLLRYLRRSRDVIETQVLSSSIRRTLTDDELSPAAITAYEAVEDLIQEVNTLPAMKALPISPIDYITARLEQEGIRVGEITGRTVGLKYYLHGGRTEYYRRSSTNRQTSKIVDGFNNGTLDVIVANRSGATGISLHASEKFQDQRQRVMNLLQVEPDINTAMQFFGRIDRTGQVVPPQYNLVIGDIPAERRPAGVFMKKLSSLSANTSGARKSGLDINVLDFMNPYGDEVVAELMMNNPRLHRKLGSPLKFSDNDMTEFETDNAAAKVTGRLPALPVYEQEAFYTELEREYTEYVNRMEALGESILEAKTLDLDARVEAVMVVSEKDIGSDSPFQAGTQIERVNIKMIHKPYSSVQALNQVRETLSMPSVLEVSDDLLRETRTAGIKTMTNLRSTLHEKLTTEAEQFREKIDLMLGSTGDSDQHLWEQFHGKQETQRTLIEERLELLPPGQTVEIKTPNDNIMYGIVDRVWKAGDADINPAAPNAWKVKVLVADSAKELVIPFSKINRARSGCFTVVQADQDFLTKKPVLDLFDSQRRLARTKAHIVTGNLFRAIESFSSGKIINFTDAGGKTRQGILLPKTFDPGERLKAMPVVMGSVNDALTLLGKNFSLSTPDNALQVSFTRQGYRLTTPASKATGGRYFLNQELLTALGQEFTSVNNEMRVTIPTDRMASVLTVLIEKQHLRLQTSSELDRARAILKQRLPTFKQVEKKMEQNNITLNNTQNSKTPDAVEDLPLSKPETTASDISRTPPRQGYKYTKFVSEDGYFLAEPGTQSTEHARNAARFLVNSGIDHFVLQNNHDGVRLESDVYQPLCIERHGNQIHLFHTRSQNGDTWIDCEAVYSIAADGKLVLAETASYSLGREFRSKDAQFAATFMANINNQGFAELGAAKMADHHTQDEKSQASPLSDQPAKPLETETPTSTQPAQTTTNSIMLEKVTEKTFAPTTAITTPNPSREPVKKHQEQAAAHPLKVLHDTLTEQSPQAATDLADQTINADQHPTIIQFRKWYQAVNDLDSTNTKRQSTVTLRDIEQRAKAAKVAIEKGEQPVLDDIEFHQDMVMYNPLLLRGKKAEELTRKILAQQGQQAKDGRIICAGKNFKAAQSANGTITLTQLRTPQGKEEKKTLLTATKKGITRSVVNETHLKALEAITRKMKQTEWSR